MSQSLLQKLRLCPGQQLTILNRPDPSYFSGLQASEIWPREPEGVIILFVKTLEELKEQTFRLIRENTLAKDGRLLIAYPKKGNPTFDFFIHRDAIFPGLGVDEEGYIGESDFKFNQMVKLDDTYTIIGIKRVNRESTRKKPARS